MTGRGLAVAVGHDVTLWLRKGAVSSSRCAMVEVARLVNVAHALLKAMEENKKHPDVQHLFENDRFMGILKAAMAGEISSPLELGIGRWILESNIRSAGEVSSNLSRFYLLLGGGGENW